MHAKVTVADDIVFVGSFNLSHSGEENAENVLELADAAVAEQLAAFVDPCAAATPLTRHPRRRPSQREKPLPLRHHPKGGRRGHTPPYAAATVFIAPATTLWSPGKKSGRYEKDQRSFEMSKVLKSLLKRKMLFAHRRPHRLRRGLRLRRQPHRRVEQARRRQHRGRVLPGHRHPDWTYTSPTTARPRLQGRDRRRDGHTTGLHEQGGLRHAPGRIEREPRQGHGRRSRGGGSLTLTPGSASPPPSSQASAPRSTAKPDFRTGG